jgi:hypothetical protein
MIRRYYKPKFDNKATNDKSIIVARSNSTGEKFYILDESNTSFYICDQIYKTKGSGFSGICCWVWKKGYNRCIHPIDSPLN